MSSVNIMGNNFGKEELSKLQITMKEHKTLRSLCGIASDATEANLAGLGMDAADAAVLAEDIQDKGALSKMTFTGDGNWGDDGDPVTVETGMTEADFSNKKLGPGLGSAGAIILAAWIENK